jgi:hypothetical protein
VSVDGRNTHTNTDGVPVHSLLRSRILESIVDRLLVLGSKAEATKTDREMNEGKTRIELCAKELSGISATGIATLEQPVDAVLELLSDR